MKKKGFDLKDWLLWLGAPVLALLIGYFYLGPNLNAQQLDTKADDEAASKMPDLSFEAGRAAEDDRGNTEVEIIPDAAD